MHEGLDALLRPLGGREFFDRYYEKLPLHLSRPASDPPLLTHEELLLALASPERPGAIVCFAEHAGTTEGELLADPASLARYLDEGHPLVWNRARGIAPGIDAVTSLLAAAFGAHVWPNVYATGHAGTPFDVHFDAHEVIAIQCEGEKAWSISEVRIDRPLGVTEMEPAIQAALRARRDEAASRPLLGFTTRPGDLVYIPRGQFHNARAQGGRSLHVTFGIEVPTGFDIARRAVLALLGDAAMREQLPAAITDPDGERARAHLAMVAGRLQEALSGASLSDLADHLRGHWVRSSLPGGKR